MYLPTLRQLQYLVAVVDLRHFGHAAEQCLVTQSTLSAGLRELETVLGVTLVERTKRRVLPTPLGETIAEKARGVLAGARDIAEVAQGGAEPLTGRFRLGVIPTIGPFVLPRLLGGLRDAYPGLQLFLREDQTAPLLDRLRRGDLEAAILALPYDLGDGMAAMSLGADPFWLAVPKDHPLAAPEVKIIQPGDVDPDDLLLLEDGHCLRDHALSACRLRVSGAGRFQATSLYTLVEMVANGLGVTFLPEVALTSGMARNPAVVVKPLADDSPPRSIGLVWRRSFVRDGDVAALGAYVKGRMAGVRMKRT